MWVVLLHHSAPILTIIKVGLEKCQIYSNKCNVYEKQFNHPFN